jgi:nicotinate-nucleotide pyrophosphorylase (carboxylating)
MLSGERTALNILQRLSGIAGLTRSYVEAVAGTSAAVLDTRKTTPLWRAWEKHAVRCGGGTNHRMGLYDRILLKDNHLALWQHSRRGTPADMVRAARAAFPDHLLEVEVDTVEVFRQVLEAGPDWVLLDNMRIDDLRRCVRLRPARTRLEASGGVTLETAAAIAATGVDAISVGALTHSAPSADLCMEMEPDG